MDSLRTIICVIHLYHTPGILQVASCYGTSPYSSLSLGVFRCRAGTDLHEVYITATAVVTKSSDAEVAIAAKHMTILASLHSNGFAHISYSQKRNENTCASAH